MGGGDRFFHLGIFDHRSDWIQDYDQAEGNLLVWGRASATANAGVAVVSEVFVIYRPTGQIIWALVDCAAEDHFIVPMNSETFDLIGYALIRACRYEANKSKSRAQFRVTFDSPKGAPITWQKISLASSVISWTILWKTWHSSGSRRRKIIPAYRKPYITKTSVDLW